MLRSIRIKEETYNYINTLATKERRSLTATLDIIVEEYQNATNKNRKRKKRV